MKITAHLRPFLIQAIPIGLVVVLLAVSLKLLGTATSSPHKAGDLNLVLIPLNGVILVILSGLILYNIIQLIARLKSHQAGSRYTARLMAAFAILTILPVLVVSFFSVNFLGDRIDAWFNVKVEGALDDSLELTKRALDIKMRQHLFNLEQVAKEMVVLDLPNPSDYAELLDQKREALGAFEIVLFNANKQIKVYSGDDTILPHFPTGDIFRKLSMRNYMYQPESTSQGELYSRIAFTIRFHIEPFILTALFPFSEKEQSLSENVTQALKEYKVTEYNRERIKQSFRITLLLIMILSILFSLLAAFLYSQKLTAPIRKLLEVTVAVGSGNLYKKIPVSDNDDFSLLASSFNTMTSRLATARKESESSQQQMQQQRDYLNIVLDHISSGVITLDGEGIIRRINAAADQVLQKPLKDYTGKSCEQMCLELESLKPLFDAIEPHFQSNEKEWQLELSLALDSGYQTLVCRGAKLPSLVDGAQGHVLVIDDITDVIRAEHDAAWSEVARRLAHEIKNPLTPIQLSAERLHFKLLPELSPKSADLLQRMSKTIINQVDNMKTMVDAFSQYARAPVLDFQLISINTLVIEVAELYRTNSQQAEIVLDLQGVPNLSLDQNRIRQMLLNLVKNALEAMPEEQAFKQIIMTTLHNHEAGSLCQDNILIEISDNGSGISEDIIADLFTPYVSNKTTGTGLGLSIVKKIVEEHSGKVFAKNIVNDSGKGHRGAKMTVCLPL
ncbi:MAG: HAMP domain-containing protein [Cocleimonas sp.]|nr:HAMP domain-containing protein [Cocleimonas sp.]